MTVPKNTSTLAILQLQMEIEYNVNAEFPFNSKENIKILKYVCKYLHQTLCMIYTNVIVMHKAGLIFIREN